jgi:hypothetical protein
MHHRGLLWARLDRELLKLVAWQPAMVALLAGLEIEQP